MRAALGLATTTAVIALLAPTAAATPESDAADAIIAAWEAAGGEASPLGAPQGDVYAAGDGFVEDFAGGKMFYTPATGARALYGPVLDKYQALGGPAGSDLGFPDADETAGLAGPDSRFVTFSATDKPVMYYTPDHGAYVVRGAINAAWDQLGSSSGTLSVPVGDEAFAGDVVSQKFGGGQVSWNRATKAFSTDPPELADQLKDLQVAYDSSTAIDWSWRATGGVSGALGAKQGAPYPVGGDGLAQNYAGGRIYFTPATGANAVTGDILAKYESLGGPEGSDLGFPVTNPADGGIPDSRFSRFSGTDQPVIFWTPDHGAFVIRDVMQAAWDKLGGATGTLGAPIGDQAVEGAVTSQKFVGGRISWDGAANRFSTEPANLASALAGLQVPGHGTPSAPPSAHGSSHRGWFAWHWWWLAVAAGVLALAGLAVALWVRRRRAAERLLMRRNGRPRVKVPVATKRLARANRSAEADAADEDPRTEDSTEQLSSYYNRPLSGRSADPDAADEEARTEDSTEQLSSYYHQPLSGRTPEPNPFDAPDDIWSTGLTDLPDDDDSGGADWDSGDGTHAGDAGDAGDTDDADNVDTAPTGIPVAGVAATGRHATAATEPVAESRSDAHRAPALAHPAIHLPLEDPYQTPAGYPIKANTVSGLYYVPDNPLYDDTLAELWFASEEVAQFNGFIRAR